MQRIDGPGATPDNLFTEGDPALGVDATTVTANWLNGVQEELIHILEEAGLTPDGAILTQVLEALRTLFVRKDVPENTMVRNLLAISAFTGNGPTPANGVFPWASLFVSEATATVPGFGNNTLMIAANAYWDGTKWKRRAGGPSVGIKFLPDSYALHMMDGGNGVADGDITWTARGKWVLGSSNVLYNTQLSPLKILSPFPSYSWTPATGVDVSALSIDRYPDDTLHIRGSLETTTSFIPSTLATVSGNPLELTDGDLCRFKGWINNSTMRTLFVRYDSGTNLTYLVGADLVPVDALVECYTVVPCA